VEEAASYTEKNLVGDASFDGGQCRAAAMDTNHTMAIFRLLLAMIPTEFGVLTK